MDKLKARNLFDGLSSTMLTASTIYNVFPTSSAPYHVNAPVTPSLANFIPSSMGGSFREDLLDDQAQEMAEGSTNMLFPVEYEDEKCQELWRAFRDMAGPWMSHRFTLNEWDKVMFKDDEQDETALDTFNGILTKHIIAPNLSRVDRCPEYQYYAYSKCVLAKKKLSDIDALKDYRYLQYVDVSSNKLKTLKALGNLPFLKYLDASHNMLGSILDFKAPYFLTYVNLSHNKITVMRDISAFWSITDLNLSGNKIKAIDGVQDLRYLTRLNLSMNRIEAVENLDNLRIHFLFLQHNLIKLTEDDRKANLHTLKNIRTINLSNNQVSSLKMFEAVENLEFLDVGYNFISTLLDIYYLRNLQFLSKLNLTGNPVASARRYINVCVSRLSHLITLDGESLKSDFWLEKLSNQITDHTQVAAHNRLKLLVLEQFNLPRIWDWLLPYDCPPIAVIILVGLRGSRCAYIARQFCKDKKNVDIGIPYTTKAKVFPGGDEDYHYVDDATFTTMLKNGEFLAYQEHFGSNYGIAHSEFRKAENGILVFYTDFTMALELKRKFVNAVLVLALPSTTYEHVRNMYDLFAHEFSSQTEFAEENEKLTMNEIEVIVDELVMNVCKIMDSSPRLSADTTVILDPSSSAESKEEGRDSLQLWWASTSSHCLSLVLHAADASSTVITGRLDMHGDESKASLDSVQNTVQIKKYVSFTLASGRKTRDNQSPSDIERSRVPKAILQPGADKETPISVKQIEERSNSQTVEQDASKQTIPFPSTDMAEVDQRMAEIVSRDGRMKYLLDEELRQRDELLELHWLMPGTFRELLFTDQEEETFDKLNTLLEDVTKYWLTTKKGLLNFDNDKSFIRMTNDKIANCFKELQSDVSISQKQAAEFPVIDELHFCDNTFCENPNCVKW